MVKTRKRSRNKKKLKIEKIKKPNSKVKNMLNDYKKKLYRLTAGKRIVEWSISLSKTNDDTYVINTEHGQKGGKIIKDKGRIVAKGKAGRSTLEQAKSQYKSLLKKKLDKGYTCDICGVNKDLPIAPMLAQSYEKHKKKIIFPALAQPKLDGVRCNSRVIDGKVTLLSRTGKAFENLDQISNAIETINLPKNIILDGELFSDELDFQRVVGLVRKKKLNNKDLNDMTKVKFSIFDLIDLNKQNMPFYKRWDRVKSIVKKDKSDMLQLVKVYPVNNDAEINVLLQKFLADGDEGIMIRNRDSPYEIDKRSYNLQKYKKFIDTEYEIIGATEGKGNDKGTVIWICKTQNGTTFNVKPKGTRKDRKEKYKDRKKYYGKLLTVKYQELTNDGIPRFPVGIVIRDYE